MRIALVLAAVAVAVAAGGPASAQDLPPITHRDWAIDLYEGVALGNARIVGMGGAAVAVAEGSAGTLANPAAGAVRPATSSSYWDWDFHFDAQSASYASDFDNNGRVDPEGQGVSNATAGLAILAGPWAFVAVVTGATTTLDEEGALTASGARAKIAVAVALREEIFTVGVAARTGELTVSDDDGDLFALTGAGLEVGVVWRPPRRDLRIGAALSLPFAGRDVDTASCDPMDCRGHILPDRVEVPWQVAIGAALRLAPTRWNQPVGGWFRDERAVLAAVDLVVTGAVPDGYGLGAFADRLWQPSGRQVAVAARAGVEWECVPGRLRLRGGTYWEPGRFEDVSGRPHVTAGIEGGYFDFRLWGNRYRLRGSFTADLAPRYSNGGVSIGFWH